MKFVLCLLLTRMTGQKGNEHNLHNDHNLNNIEYTVKYKTERIIIKNSNSIKEKENLNLNEKNNCQ